MSLKSSSHVASMTQIKPQPSKTHVTFTQVRSKQEKITYLLQVAQSHFYKKEPLQIYAEDEKLLQFLDDILWSYPKQSFLPHLLSHEPTDELLVISSHSEPLNEARSVLNFSPSPIESSYIKIFETEDLYTPEDKGKYHAYKALGHHIVTRSVSDI